MLKLLKTVGTALLGVFAVPLAGIAGIGGVISLIGLFFSSSDKFLWFTAVLGFGSVFVLCVKFLHGLSRKASGLVDKINQENRLNFNSANMLGYPSPAFLVFDSQNRKLAMCNSTSGDYRIYELSYILAWHYDWRDVSDWEVSGMATPVPGSNIGLPNLQRTTHRAGFTLVVEVADENNPILAFPMPTEQRAAAWCAKLNAIVNG